ncbi:MspA family porin [Nocardia sp. NPDC051990]|uniref:MspA family porin n=1 Tax=Nocardia sp. NPDC051990 TaxID=3155285 RepID=UPI003429DD1E
MRGPLIAATAAAFGVVVLGLWAWSAEPGRAQPPGAEVSGSGVHLSASVDHVGVNPSGDQTPNFLMTFSRAAQMSGSYSINVEGDPITSGQAVAGFILGCGISVAGGVTVGIQPNQGLVASISPKLSPPSVSVSPPSASVSPPDISLAPSVGGTLGATEVVVPTLGPGQVTTATTPTVALDGNTVFPYHITFNNAALNVAQCASPVSAVPFATSTVSTAHTVVQTTAYGDQFTF